MNRTPSPVGFDRDSFVTLRPRFDRGETLDALAREANVSRVTMWRRIGRPARYLVRHGEAPTPTFAAWAAGFFDGEGTVSINPRGRVTVVASVRPMLRVKGPVADLALADLARPGRRGCPLSPADVAQRHELYLTARALNQRGA